MTALQMLERQSLGFPLTRLIILEEIMDFNRIRKATAIIHKAVVFQEEIKIGETCKKVANFLHQ